MYFARQHMLLTIACRFNAVHARQCIALALGYSGTRAAGAGENSRVPRFVSSYTRADRERMSIPQGGTTCYRATRGPTARNAQDGGRGQVPAARHHA